MAAILIVEDEEKIARFVELELQHEGYETGKATDGLSGLSLAESGKYDLMILDIMLPGINGLEVLRRLRKTSDMPVILLTARDAVMDKVSGLEMGADDYMTKPCHRRTSGKNPGCTEKSSKTEGQGSGNGAFLQGRGTAP